MSAAVKAPACRAACAWAQPLLLRGRSHWRPIPSKDSRYVAPASYLSAGHRSDRDGDRARERTITATGGGITKSRDVTLIVTL
jgi:hypothetical protein